MSTKSFAKIAFVVALVATAMSPAVAREPNACARPELRCTAAATCDKDGWCKVYGCVLNKTVLLPFACNEKMGGCFQKHC